MSEIHVFNHIDSNNYDVCHSYCLPVVYVATHNYACVCIDTK